VGALGVCSVSPRPAMSGYIYYICMCVSHNNENARRSILTKAPDFNSVKDDRLPEL
jgi:hypothetical protein